MSASSLLDEFWKKLTRSRHRVLLSDYDGTLAGFQVERGKAVPYPGVREVLNTILRAGGCRVVIISGRRAEELLGLLGLERQPEIWGSHGIERLYPDGRYEIIEFEEKARDGLGEANAWMRAHRLQDLGEHKPGCLALHWRGMPEERVARLRELIGDPWSRIAEKAGLTLQEFDGGIELRVPGRDKGDAVSTILAEEGPDTTVACLGDDLTDEDAFAALAGKGLGVLVRQEWRPTTASLWLRPPEELLTFLARWAKTCKGK